MATVKKGRQVEKQEGEGLLDKRPKESELVNIEGAQRPKKYKKLETPKEYIQNDDDDYDDEDNEQTYKGSKQPKNKLKYIDFNDLPVTPTKIKCPNCGHNGTT